MMPCLHYGCNFRNENGFCKVTTCANPDYNGMTIRVANTIKVSPKTNADRIRAMSDEEMALFLEEVADGCDSCPMLKECTYSDEEVSEKQIRLKWLKQEVDK